MDSQENKIMKKILVNTVNCYPHILKFMWRKKSNRILTLMVLLRKKVLFFLMVLIILIVAGFLRDRNY